MKITVFIGSLYGGGAERVACNLGDYFTETGCTVEFLTMAESKTYNLRNEIKRTILLREDNRRGFIHNTIFRLRGLRTYLSQDQSDCILVMLPITTILLLLFRKSVRCKIIASERSDPSKYSLIIRLLLKWLAPRADGFVFQTPEARQWYGKRIKEPKAVIIPNAINKEFIELKEPVRNREKTIVGMGRLNDIKNFELLIESFSMIANEFPDFQLHIYGDGPSRQKLCKLAEEKQLQERIFIPGQIENIAERVNQASLFIMSSNYEGMPNALMESMALGLPCISTNCGGGVRYLVRNLENGILVPINDAEKLADAIRRVLTDQSLAAKLSNNAKNIRNTLSPDKIYFKWEKEIMRVCEQG